MSEKTKIILGVVLGIVGAILLFCLIVVIGCSVNGLTFGQQVCAWFGGKPTVPEAIEDVEQVAKAMASTPIV